jgi:hypothetical protein
MAKEEKLIRVNIEEYLDNYEIDSIRAMLTYILIHNTDLDLDTIYSIVFKEGDNITWH